MNVLRSRCFIRKWVNPTFPDWSGLSPILIVGVVKLYVDRRNVDPVVSGTSGGAQGRSSWEGAPKAQYRPKAGKKKKIHEVGLFFSGSCFVLDASSSFFPPQVDNRSRRFRERFGSDWSDS